LVIVESPAKAKTIARFLGDDFVVESSIGHIRDLPRRAAEIPAAYRDQPWARELGVDVDHGFTPLYIVAPDKKSQVAKLRALLKDADELYLATDEDREGEAIAWHLLEVLKPKVPVKRMVFHEITPQAIQRAVSEPRDLDERLVDAQETRRILDRLYGYKVSPVLWKKVMPKLSAGRVQSVATRILVERERARMRFVAASYWDLSADFRVARPQEPGAPTSLSATLVSLGEHRVATGRDFGDDGALTGARETVVLDEVAAVALTHRLAGRPAEVASVETRPYRRSPYPPFMTSTLQQEAARKLRMSADRAMATAQRLYENGYITYMRTDSTTLSTTAVAAAREQARLLYGADHVPDAPRTYARKVKNAQEAHEAIRPAGDTFRTPGEVAREISGDELRLYELIWQRTVASQMADARGTSATVRIAVDDALFQAGGKVITFPGFLRAYVEGSDDPEAELEDRERRLPVLEVGDAAEVASLAADGHQTQAPARYTEASLIKALEDLGVGRPSTYATILSTVQDRGYARKKGSALVPSWMAFAVVGLLEQHFARLVDYEFTASMEDDLDAIAEGREDSTSWLTRFYFGADSGKEGGIARAGGLKKLVEQRLEDIDAREVNSIPIGTASDGAPIVVRVGRFGPYVQHGDERASLADDLPPDELSVQRAEELLSAPSGDRDLGLDPVSGHPVVAKVGRYGPYVSTAPPDGEKPRTSSLFSTMSLETVTLDDALRLLTLPRVLGADPAGAEVSAQSGRYGPYVRRGTDSRSLDSEEQLFTVTLEEALARLAQPRTRGRAGAAGTSLAELGPDPATGRPMLVKDGRFGPYVTDGEINASLRRGDVVESLTAERGAELLADRRAKGPTPPRKRRSPAKASR
jgi:DNA topoisomerase-1